MTGQFAPFQTDITHAIAATDLRAGDAVNNSTHIMLFKAWISNFGLSPLQDRWRQWMSVGSATSAM